MVAALSKSGRFVGREPTSRPTSLSGYGLDNLLDSDKNAVTVKKPIAIDLFSGCGGLTLGLRKAGFRVVGAVEADPLAVETYRANHARVRVWPEDIREVPAKDMMKKLSLCSGQLDLLAGCPPCQGFSRMTTLNGRIGQDEQNDLVFEFLRFVRVFLPKAVMLENVPKLAKNRRFKTLRCELRKLGYSLKYDILDAANYGVPQRRRRLIMLAGRHGEIPFARPATRRSTVREALGKLLPRRARTDALHVLGEKRSEAVKAVIRMVPRDGGSRLDLGRKHQLKCHRKCDGFKDVYGRMAWDKVSPTVTGGCVNPSKGRFLHPTKDRCITLREAALLQSFPLTHRFSLRRGSSPLLR